MCCGGRGWADTCPAPAGCPPTRAGSSSCPAAATRSDWQRSARWCRLCRRVSSSPSPPPPAGRTPGPPARGCSCPRDTRTRTPVFAISQERFENKKKYFIENSEIQVQGYLRSWTSRQSCEGDTLGQVKEEKVRLARELSPATHVSKRVRRIH